MSISGGTISYSKHVLIFNLFTCLFTSVFSMNKISSDLEKLTLLLTSMFVLLLLHNIHISVPTMMAKECIIDLRQDLSFE